MHTRDSDDIEDEPVNVMPFRAWTDGVIMPLICVVYGIICIVTQNAIWPVGDRWDDQEVLLIGKAAICFGIGLFGLASIFFGDRFLANFPKVHWLSVILTHIGIITLSISLIGVVIYAVVFDMFR
ncbi:MAG: hypothetical protein ACF8OB_14900 [Phycisphaeraceae bacterium JB051]